ncbi:MAG: hypothetical protein E7311_00150 [Clostridiales bacterium]|nr:hypothetical protein [Clostridiales bacterium]
MKILIIGAVGSGKTTLARKLAKKYNIDHYEIDSIVHDDNNNGKKRTETEQYEIIMEINKKESWIIEGTLRKHLDYLLKLSDKIVLVNTPLYKRKIRIFTRYIKQKLHIEKCNYAPNMELLKQMFEWTSDYENNRGKLSNVLDNYSDKIEVIK